MVDDDKYKTGGADEEYEFSEMPGGDVESEDDFANTKFVPPAGVDDIMAVRGESHMTRNIIIGVVAVVLGFAGYKLAGVYLSPKTDSEMLLAKTDEQTTKQAGFEEFLKPSKSQSELLPIGTTPEVKAEVKTEETPVATVEEKAPEKIQMNMFEKALQKVETKVEQVSEKVETKAPEKVEVKNSEKAATVSEPTKMSETTPLPPRPTKSTHTETSDAPVTNVTISKELERKLSAIADQASASQESIRHFESTLSGLQSGLDRLDQRLTALDDQVRQAKAQMQRTTVESALKAKPRREPVNRPAFATPANDMAEPAPVMTQSKVLDCYKLESLNRRSITLVRQDNSRRYEVYVGGRIPRLSRDEGVCTDTKQFVELKGINTESGAIYLSNGLHLETTAFFAVDAMVEGRAWLKTENGSTITVDRGSILPGYGRVMNIDVVRGVVTTSSGKVIQYSADER